MIEKRYNHASLCISNKMFVIGGRRKSTCEMFDSFSRTLCYIKTCSGFTNNLFRFQAICICNQIAVFIEVCNVLFQTEIFTYCTETCEWKFIDCDILKNKCRVSCVNYHQ